MSALTDPAALPSPARLAMGLRPLGDGPVLVPDGERESELALKHDLWAAQGREVFDALPGCEDAQHEVLTLLSAELANRHGLAFAPGGRAALLEIGLAVQEDLLLLAPHGPTYRLVAGALFFPALWRLQDKMGKGLAAIHGPVPNYPAQLETGMDRLFAHLQAGQPLERFNWTLHDSPDLYRPGAHGAAEQDWPVDPALGQKLWLRGERQVLLRLPETGLILFTIKTWRDRLDHAVAADPRWRDFLGRVLDEMPAEMKAYKSLPAREAALRAWLAEN